MELALPLVLALTQIVKAAPFPEKIDGWVHLIAPLLIGVAVMFLFATTAAWQQNTVAGLTVGSVAGYGYDWAKQLATVGK